MSRRVWAVNEPTLIALNIDIVTWCRSEIYTFQSQQREWMHDMEENGITCTHPNNY